MNNCDKDVTKMENEEWGMGNGEWEWGMGNGNGEWEMGNGNWKVRNLGKRSHHIKFRLLLSRRRNPEVALW